MSATLLWCKCSYLEFPPEGVAVWTTDEVVVRKGVWSWDWPRVELENSTCQDLDGVAIKVTHWLCAEDNPNVAPELPLLEKTDDCPNQLT